MADGAVLNRNDPVANVAGRQHHDDLLILSDRKVTAALIHHDLNALIVSWTTDRNFDRPSVSDTTSNVILELMNDERLLHL